MKLIGKLSVSPALPRTIDRLEELAYNLWWSWEPDAQELYAQIDSTLWIRVNQNPVKFLRQVDQHKLDTAAADKTFVKAYKAVLKEFDAYMSATDTWYKTNHKEKAEKIAYFSAEFGLHEALPIYSGGLGILSGDHCKAASDLDLPFVGVGFLYPQGYFTQFIDHEGMQQARNEKLDFAEVPATPALTPDGKPAIINVDLPGRTVYAKVWRIQVGRIPIYLMDTDVERNAPQDRELSARLYGGDHEMRVSQEVVLGIGGVRALRALGIDPTVWHMNEGHSAFLGLERIRELVQQKNLSFDQALEVVRANSLFTTHTPVPAGNDAFAHELIEKFFWQYWGQLGIDRDRFINFASQELAWGPQFSMTVLALRLSAYHNGVSKLHGQVSRLMWQFLWPDTPVEETPITHVTNGVHVKTWLAPELRELYNKYFEKNWLDQANTAQAWEPVDKIPAADLWAVHQTRKVKMIDLVRRRVAAQLTRHGEGPQTVATAAQLLDPNAFTIGFARRFATYKRATLIFRDEERLQRLLNDPERPVQIIFSGKAHPADEPGRTLIQHIYQLSRRPEYWGKIVFVENYDMNIARHLISGVDVWLNTPRRPHEASGTSGQKAALSGAPNFSVLDGWWVEGFSGEDKAGEDGRVNGWSIGEERDYKDQETQDAADALDFYTKLEHELIPLYYDQDKNGLSTRWIECMKNSIRSCGPAFSMRRMVIDYTQDLYLPAAESGKIYAADGFANARQISVWKAQTRQAWSNLRVETVAENGSDPHESMNITVGDSMTFSARVHLNGVPQDQVAVEIVSGIQNAAGEIMQPEVTPMTPTGQENGAVQYSGKISPTTSGQIAIGIRARPIHEKMVHPHELGISRWA